MLLSTLPVVLTAEGSTYDITRAFINVCLRSHYSLSSSLTRWSPEFVVLNGKQYARAISSICTRDPLAPCAPLDYSATFTLHIDSKTIYRLSAVVALRALRIARVTLRSARLLQVTSRKRIEYLSPYARTNGEPYGLLSAMF